MAGASSYWAIVRFPFLIHNTYLVGKIVAVSKISNMVIESFRDYEQFACIWFGFQKDLTTLLSMTNLFQNTDDFIFS